MDSPNDPKLTLPAEIGAVLESTFLRLLAESAFADAWQCPDLAQDDLTIGKCPLQVVLPIRSPWRGTLLVAGDRETVSDLAAGFHSIPDAMVDEGIALEFLAELGGLLLRDLFCAVDDPVELAEPSTPDPEKSARLWSASLVGRSAVGCNEGLLLVALRPLAP